METWEERERRIARDREAYVADLKPLPDGDKRKLIKAASKYRSGEDSCNSVYMGGIAQAMLRRALGGGSHDALPPLLKAANTSQLDEALYVCWAYIKAMRENPTKKCPFCGQIVSAEG